MQGAGIALHPERVRPSQESLIYFDSRKESAMASHPRTAKPPRGRIARTRPVWDAATGALWWDGRVVKRVYRDAPNQRLVLATFDESGWPERIDDPLPGQNGTNRKSRVRETAKSLNRGAAPGTIVFHADGTGTGFRWRFG
jgi:hypothetical protein